MTTRTAEKPIESLERRYRKNPASYVFSRLADAYRREGDINKAVEICESGLDLHPSSVTGRIILGQCYLEQEKLNEAVEEFTKVCTFDRKNQMAIKMLADIFARQGIEQKAADLYAILRKADPKNESLLRSGSKLSSSGKTDLFEILGISEPRFSYSEQKPTQVIPTTAFTQQESAYEQIASQPDELQELSGNEPESLAGVADEVFAKIGNLGSAGVEESAGFADDVEELGSANTIMEDFGAAFEAEKSGVSNVIEDSGRSDLLENSGSSDMLDCLAVSDAIENLESSDAPGNQDTPTVIENFGSAFTSEDFGTSDSIDKPGVSDAVENVVTAVDATDDKEPVPAAENPETPVDSGSQGVSQISGDDISHRMAMMFDSPKPGIEEPEPAEEEENPVLQKLEIEENIPEAAVQSENISGLDVSSRIEELFGSQDSSADVAADIDRVDVPESDALDKSDKAKSPQFEIEGVSGDLLSQELIETLQYDRAELRKELLLDEVADSLDDSSGPDLIAEDSSTEPGLILIEEEDEVSNTDLVAEPQQETPEIIFGSELLLDTPETTPDQDDTLDASGTKDELIILDDTGETEGSGEEENSFEEQLLAMTSDEDLIVLPSEDAGSPDYPGLILDSSAETVDFQNPFSSDDDFKPAFSMSPEENSDNMGSANPAGSANLYQNSADANLELIEISDDQEDTADKMMLTAEKDDKSLLDLSGDFSGIDSSDETIQAENETLNSASAETVLDILETAGETEKEVNLSAGLSASDIELDDPFLAPVENDLEMMEIQDDDSKEDVLSSVLSDEETLSDDSFLTPVDDDIELAELTLDDKGSAGLSADFNDLQKSSSEDPFFSSGGNDSNLPETADAEGSQSDEQESGNNSLEEESLHVIAFDRKEILEENAERGESDSVVVDSDSSSLSELDVLTDDMSVVSGDDVVKKFDDIFAEGNGQETVEEHQNRSDRTQIAEEIDLTEDNAQDQQNDDTILISWDAMKQKFEDVLLGQDPLEEKITSAIPEQDETPEENETGFYTLSGDEALNEGIIQAGPEVQDDVENSSETRLPIVEKETEPGFISEMESVFSKEKADDITETVAFQADDEPVRGEETGAEEESSESTYSIPDHVITPTLADIYYQQGQYGLAVQIYTRLLDRDPDNEKIQKRLNQVKMAMEQNAALAPVPEPKPAMQARPVKTAPVKKGKRVLHSRGTAAKKKKTTDDKRPLAGVKIRKSKKGSKGNS
ncbi:MAG: tetratricopeptide repeat protein [Fibrobacter sp.]|nr:tetratricopeptide repeat protein [Fibrobacter sp.]